MSEGGDAHIFRSRSGRLSRLGSFDGPSGEVEFDGGRHRGRIVPPVDAEVRIVHSESPAAASTTQAEIPANLQTSSSADRKRR